MSTEFLTSAFELAAAKPVSVRWLRRSAAKSAPAGLDDTHNERALKVSQSRQVTFDDFQTLSYSVLRWRGLFPPRLPEEIQKRHRHAAPRDGPDRAAAQAGERGSRAMAVQHEDNLTVTPGSGNVFADLGVAEPEEELAKAQLAVHIRDAIKRRRLTQAEAARLVGLDQPKIRPDERKADRLFQRPAAPLPDRPRPGRGDRGQGQNRAPRARTSQGDRPRRLMGRARSKPGTRGSVVARAGGGSDRRNPPPNATVCNHPTRKIGLEPRFFSRTVPTRLDPSPSKV